jgi:hypothetical protein
LKVIEDITQDIVAHVAQFRHVKHTSEFTVEDASIGRIDFVERGFGDAIKRVIGAC